jgi:hypothetical protein
MLPVQMNKKSLLCDVLAAADSRFTMRGLEKLTIDIWLASWLRANASINRFTDKRKFSRPSSRILFSTLRGVELTRFSDLFASLDQRA